MHPELRWKPISLIACHLCAVFTHEIPPKATLTVALFSDALHSKRKVIKNCEHRHNSTIRTNTHTHARSFARNKHSHKHTQTHIFPFSFTCVLADEPRMVSKATTKKSAPCSENCKPFECNRAAFVRFVCLCFMCSVCTAVWGAVCCNATKKRRCSFECARAQPQYRQSTHNKRRAPERCGRFTPLPQPPHTYSTPIIVC